MNRSMLKITLWVLCSFVPLAGQEKLLVNMDTIYPEELTVVGFQLPVAQTVQIQASGVYQKDGERMFILGYAWILDATTRQLVWEMPPSDRLRGRIELQEVSESLNLPAGTYAAYYSSYRYSHRGSDWKHDFSWEHNGFFGNFFSWLFDRDYGNGKFGRYRSLGRDFRFTIAGEGQGLDSQELVRLTDELYKGAVIKLTGNRDNGYLYQGFQLNEPAELEVFCQGEATRDGEYDYGWITDLETRQRVWQMAYRQSQSGGGARKNRVVRETLALPAGKYAAYYVTDDSHSPQEWNSPPPYDPDSWGMVLTPLNAAAALSLLEYSPLDESKMIVSLAPLRDHDFASRGFTLKKPMSLHIYAIGEGRDGEMFDYGWIVDAGTRERVWEMTCRNTVHAGGNAKNRMFDGLVEFAAGSYIAYFVTDDSHSFRDWNASPPFDQKYWGLTITGTGSAYREAEVSDYRESEDINILAKIKRVRDGQELNASFTLNKEAKVRIYALGEGSGGRMFDYGWIEESKTGKVIWEMSYRLTDHAGGARKNRLFNDTVSLPAGEYRLHYQSDDSHSFDDWNDAPPFDPEYWGITVYRTEEKSGAAHRD